MAEWSNAADSKSVVLLVGTGGSNPPLSAKQKGPYMEIFFYLSIGLVIFILYLDIFYLIQNWVLFYPSIWYKSPEKISMPEFKENIINGLDGMPIMTWYYKGKKNKPAILFLHGNAWQIGTFAPQLKSIMEEGYSILAMEYRGFANTRGHIAFESTLQDSILAFDWLKAQGHSKIIVYAYSFGTAFACALTLSRPIDGMILTSAFSSLKKLVMEKPIPFAFLALKDKYVSVDYLKKFDKPLLLIHGKNDHLIPYHHSQILYDNALTKDKKLVLIDKANHHTIYFSEKNIPAILEFLKRKWG